jgi:hypothetical protein
MALPTPVPAEDDNAWVSAPSTVACPAALPIITKLTTAMVIASVHERINLSQANRMNVARERPSVNETSGGSRSAAWFGASVRNYHKWAAPERLPPIRDHLLLRFLRIALRRALLLAGPLLHLCEFLQLFLRENRFDLRSCFFANLIRLLYLLFRAHRRVITHRV